VGRKEDNVSGVGKRFTSGLKGPCSNKRLFSKKSLDHTQIAKV
jgi:hypothetical protein